MRKFEPGKCYRISDRSLQNTKIYKCEKSMDGYLRLYYDHKGSTFSMVVETGWSTGLKREQFHEVSEDGIKIGE